MRERVYNQGQDDAKLQNSANYYTCGNDYIIQPCTAGYCHTGDKLPVGWLMHYPTLYYVWSHVPYD